MDFDIWSIGNRNIMLVFLGNVLFYLLEMVIINIVKVILKKLSCGFELFFLCIKLFLNLNLFFR